MNRDIKAWLDAVPEDKRSDIAALRALIGELYPQADVVVSYGILMYRVKPGWVGLGYRKGGVSIYTNGPQHLAQFKEKQPGVKCGKGCINLKLGEALPLADLKQVIRHAMEQAQ